MTADELLERRICCGLGCQNCPYDPPHKKGNKTIRHLKKELDSEPIQKEPNHHIGI